MGPADSDRRAVLAAILAASFAPKALATGTEVIG
jgi:hypothetical protein